MAKEAPDEIAAVQAAAASAPDVRALALACAQSTGGDVSEAARHLLSGLIKDYPSFYAEKAAKAMQLWAESAVREAASAVRRSISSYSAPIAAPGKAALSASADRNFAMCWMNWQVAPGIQLSDATRPQLLKASEFYMACAATQSARGQWLAAIAEKLKDDKTPVKAKFAEKDVAKMAAEFKVSKE